MNKKIMSVFTTAVFVFGFAGLVHAADANDQAAQIAAKRAELNNHEWEVKVSPLAGKGDVETDTLVFKDQKFESKALAEKGYKTTNYTVSLQEGGPTVWETMQSAEDGKTVSWRGEWTGDSMWGIMSKQSDGKSKDFRFASMRSKAIEKAPEPVPVVAEQAVEAVKAEGTEAVAEQAAKVEETAPAQVVEQAAPMVEEAKAEPKKEQPKKKNIWGF